ncbi:MAG: hypothetical protein Fur0021_40400 [Candidatus Promineifilaceae bacterium]
MNPFTRFLSRHLHDPSLTDFVAHWDRLERLVIAIYKRQQTLPADEAEWAALRPWLLAHYPHWQPALVPLWSQTLIGGQPATADPFTTLLAPASAAAFIHNWSALQTLPAAREALNQLVQQKATPP